MKSQLLTAAAAGALMLAATSTAQAENRFAGFTASLDLGWTQVMGQINDVNPNYANVAGYQDVDEGSGVLLGGRLGYDFALGDQWLAGAELNVNMVSADTATCEAAGCADSNSATGPALSFDMESLASARARLGYVIDPKALLYGFVGYAYSEVTTHHHDSSEGDGRSRNFHGYTLGGGAQYAVGATTDVRGEVAYYNFSDKIYTDQFDETFGSDPEALTVSLGVVFHLN